MERSSTVAPTVVSPGEDGLLDQIAGLGRDLGHPDVPATWADLIDCEWPPVLLPAHADRQLIQTLRVTLVRVAAAHRMTTADEPTALLMVRGAIDGAHLTARNEILTGNRDQLRQLIPGLLYATLNPIADESVALRVAARAVTMLEAGR